MDEKPLTVTVSRAAKLMDRSSKTVLRRIADGSLEARKINAQYNVVYRSLERFLGIDGQPDKSAA